MQVPISCSCIFDIDVHVYTSTYVYTCIHHVCISCIHACKHTPTSIDTCAYIIYLHIYIHMYTYTRFAWWQLAAQPQTGCRTRRRRITIRDDETSDDADDHDPQRHRRCEKPLTAQGSPQDYMTDCFYELGGPLKEVWGLIEGRFRADPYAFYKFGSPFNGCPHNESRSIWSLY